MARIVIGLLLCLVSVVSVYIMYYENPSFFIQKLVNPTTWGTVQIVEKKPIGSVTDFFQSEVVWQILEQLFGFVTGVLICILIGWRVSSYRNIYEKSFENSLAECIRRQTRFEKQLSALELQIVDFERSYLYAQKDRVERCESCLESFPFIEDVKEIATDEVDETYNKHSDDNEGLVRQTVEAIMKRDLDESNFACILEKLTKILDRLSKLSKVEINPALVSDNSLVQEQEGENVTCEEEFYDKENVLVDDKVDELEETTETVDKCEEEIVTGPEKGDEMNYQYSDLSNESSPYELHPCASSEEISDVVLSVVGGGECNETFRGKIVPVSQIPKYQELRKSQKQKAIPQKEYDDDIPFIISRNTHDLITEKTSPQPSPKADRHSERSVSRGGRRKQRS